MPKKKRPKRHLRAVPNQGAYAQPSPEHMPLIQDLRAALRAEDLLALLGMISGIMTVTDPRMADPLSTGQRLPLADFVETLIGASFAETTAALHVIRVLTTDELTRARIAAELAHRRHPMPAWLTRLDEATAESDVWFLTHVQGDGDDYLLQVTLATGEPITALVYVDHNMGSIVKDAFPIPDTLENVVVEMGLRIDRAEQTLIRTDPAGARAAVERAIDFGARTLGAPESDSWPQFRPLLEWMVRKLPEGGAAPEVKAWTEEEKAALAGEFFTSHFGEQFTEDDDARSLLNSILWFGTEYAGSDPFRWSPVNVEIILVDWFHRKVMAPPEYLARMPEVLRAFIRYSHDRTSLPAHLTADTLAAVDHWEPEFQALVRSGKRTGTAAIAAALMERIESGELDPSMLGGDGLALSELGLDKLFDSDDDDAEWQEYVQASLASEVGGAQALANLTVEPLPDEPFEWEGVADDIRPVVEEILTAGDRCAEELLDVELRTVMQRLLHRIAVADPALFRRRSSPQRAAATIAWLTCQANRDFGRSDPTAPVRGLLAHFGLKSPVSDRAETFRRALGLSYNQYGAPTLGSADLLTSRARAELITARDAGRMVW